MDTQRAKTVGGLVLVCGLSTGFLSIQLYHVFVAGETLRALMFGSLLQMAQAVGMLAGGIRLRHTDFTGAEVVRIAVWCVFGAMALGTGAFFTILYQQIEGVLMDGWWFIIANAATTGMLGGFVAGVYDGRQRVAQRKAAAAGERAERLSEQLTVLNRILRHDIRNGVNIVRGYARLIAEDRPAAADRAEKIEAEAQRLVELGEQAREIEAVLRSDGGDREVVDIIPVVEMAVDYARTARPDAEVSVALPDRLPVRAHPLISSAFRNVVENAVEHCDEPTPRITIEAERIRRGERTYVELRVADNGPGIPDQEVSVIERGFETSLEHGSGLGLWLVHWLVTASDGHVRFEDNDPKGSTVCLQFEATEMPAEVPEPKEAETAVSTEVPDPQEAETAVSTEVAER